MRRFHWFAGAVVGLVWSLGAVDARANIYQFTDQNGVIHFTNQKPNDPRFRLYLKGNDGPRRAYSGPVVPPSDRDIARFTRFDEWIREASTLYQIPEQLIRAVIKVESDFDPRAVSRSGARGLMQLMPDTADRLQVRNIDDPRENIFGGTRYLRILANTFNGDLDLTVAAYNAGEGAVMNHGGIPPYPETREYVTRVNRFYRRYRTMPDVAAASGNE
jgi:soluble lytic murein transglycosylase-like protein